jgi:Type II secretion system (T2SS), protein G
MKKIILIALALLGSSTLSAGAPYVPTDAERARWTMSDMGSWRMALQAYAQDHKTYPAAKDLGELRKALEGKYMAVAPLHDAWGHPYHFERTGDGFRLVSGGADGKLDAQSWTDKGRAASLADDAVMTNEGPWLARSWSLD